MKKPEEMTPEELSKAIDEDAMGIGLAIATIYKTVTTATAHLPNMELHTETICLSVDDNGVSVHIGRPHGRHCGYDRDEDCDDFDFENEEERLYDEID